MLLLYIRYVYLPEKNHFHENLAIELVDDKFEQHLFIQFPLYVFVIK